MSKSKRAVSRVPASRRVQVKNMTLQGNGAGGKQDRGAGQSASLVSSNPYNYTVDTARWQEYTRWYKTAWEAQKIIDIPVDDALREAFDITGVDEADAKRLKAAYDAHNLDKQVRRALIQERLYGGSVLLPIINLPEKSDLSVPMESGGVDKGDLLAVNVIDISKISRTSWDSNPFSPYYDRADALSIQGIPVHVSRMIVLDGAPLLNPVSRHMLEARTSGNQAGFGESKLTPLYDILTRMTGTQQGAYHLVNLASVLLVQVDNLISMEAGCSPARQALQEIVEMISIYRGAVIDAKGATVSQHAASFGSVPELVMTFAQLLSAASDIPAARFLGQAPGGLNTSGDGDLENYYNMIDAYQRLTVKPIHLQLLSYVGASLWGRDVWAEKSQNIDITYPTLWNLTEKEAAEMNKTYADMLANLYTVGVLGADTVVAELVARKVFKTEAEAEESISDLRSGVPPAGATEGTLSQIEDLKASPV